MHAQILENRTVVVAGGSSGIGLGIAQACVEKGATVVIVGRNVERIDLALAHLDEPARTSGIATDVTDENAVRRLFGRLGPIDHVVLTAAAPHYGRVRDLDLAEARLALEAKVIAALSVAKHADLTPTGSLVLTAGIATDRPAPGGAVVTAANGALVALVRALALELAPVRVNAVAPGWIDTPLWDTIAGDSKGQRMAELAAKLPAARVGTPADIAAAVIFLLSSAFTTGETLHVDGGHRLV